MRPGGFDPSASLRMVSLSNHESNRYSSAETVEKESPSFLETGAFMRGIKLVCETKINNLAATPLRIGS